MIEYPESLAVDPLRFGSLIPRKEREILRFPSHASLCMRNRLESLETPKTCIVKKRTGYSVLDDHASCQLYVRLFPS